MQHLKRRGHKSANDLPVTMSDVCANKRGHLNINSQRACSSRRDGSNPSTLRTCSLFTLFIVLLVVLLTQDLDYISGHPATQKVTATIKGRAAMLQNPLVPASPPREVLPSLAKFKTLQYALENSNIVGIYFAAKWCPMSTPVTETLEKLFSFSVASADAPDGFTLDHRVLSPPESVQSSNIHVGGAGKRKDFALIYVSSDKNEEDAKEYSRYNWINVPFESPDRSELKRHFRACAKVEMKELGIEPRRFQIPTLLIVDTATQGILSSNGVDELEEYGTDVLDHWLQLQQLARSLEDKYLVEN